MLVTKSVSFINGYNHYGSFRVPVEDGAVQLEKTTDRVGIFLRAVNESGGGAVERIEVKSPSGHSVALLTPQDSINAPVPSGGYLSVLRFFHVDETGEYHVTASVGAAARGAELGVGKYDVENLTAWLAGGFAVGGAIFLIGLVMLIIVLVRRSRSKREVRMAGIPPVAPYWGPPGAAPPPPPGWGATPTGPPSQYPPYPPPPQQPGGPDQTASSRRRHSSRRPSQPPQPQQPVPPPGWGSPTPAAPPPPPEQWAPAPWSTPTVPAPPHRRRRRPLRPVPAPSSPAPSASPPSGVPAPPASAPIPTVRPWRNAPARPAPEPEPDDDAPGAPDGGDP